MPTYARTTEARPSSLELLGIVMLTRRIVMSACALCLAVPAAAGASPAMDPPKAAGPPGITTPTDTQNVVKAKGPYGASGPNPQNVVKAKGPYGVTVSTDPQNVVKAVGPYGATAAVPRNLVKAKGPYGATVGTNLQTVTGSTPHSASASSHDNSNGWRIAAIAQAALLAALALVSVLFLSARHRATGLAT
jgi:hypothetical protein